jgi:Tfp pilus assembly protein PilV
MMTNPWRAIRRLARDNAGFSVVEVLIAALLLTVGLLAALYGLVASNHLNLTTQRVQATATAAENAMEQLRAMPYSSLALSSLPTHTSDGNASSDKSGNPFDPDYWVSGTNFLVVADYSQESSLTLSGVSSSGEAMIGSGAVNPGPVNVASDGFTVSVYTFISWVNDSCVYLGLNLCPGGESAKRLTVAAVLDGGGGVGADKPFWLSTVVANPDAGLTL